MSFWMSIYVPPSWACLMLTIQNIPASPTNRRFLNTSLLSRRNVPPHPQQRQGLPFHVLPIGGRKSSRTDRPAFDTRSYQSVMSHFNTPDSGDSPLSYPNPTNPIKTLHSMLTKRLSASCTVFRRQRAFYRSRGTTFGPRTSMISNSM
jgi:hypothetical protein